MTTGTTLDERCRSADRRRAPGSAQHDDSEIVTFPDLVRAHQAWERELYGCSP